MKTSIAVHFALALILTGPSLISCQFMRNNALPTKMDPTLKHLIEESVKQITKHKNENKGNAKLTDKPLQSKEIQSYLKGIGDSKYGRENVKSVTKTWITDNNNTADVKRVSRFSTKFSPDKGRGLQKQVISKKMNMELKKEKMSLSEDFPTLMRKGSRFKWQQKDFSPLMWGLPEERRRNLNNVGFAADQNMEW
ncbi:hypothetical protein JYU34_020725 [Plutella xylostella]|uniref:Uncharacterized protein n=1 Tax=Plutella xylostella TaxID=51655 RepID=A0ABQ7PUY4_PLUXY|nr:hypothetical protein JYU34_020725 [Plutella xylostella]